MSNMMPLYGLDNTMVRLDRYIAYFSRKKDYHKFLFTKGIKRHKHGEFPVSGAVTQFWKMKGESWAIICMSETPADRDLVIELGLLAHEATHVFQDWCEKKGEAKPSDEFMAYSIQLITQTLAWEHRRQYERQHPAKK